MQKTLIDIKGNNNKTSIHKGCSLQDFTFYIRDHHYEITIKDYVMFNHGGCIWIEDHNCLVEIGSKSTFENAHLACTEPNSKIIIGDDCMFANDIDVRTGDSHSILDAIRLQWINFGSDVVIKNHICISAYSSILKGVIIDENSVVSIRSVVTHSPGKSNCIIGGTPAKILREGITWTRERIYNEHYDA